MRILMVSGVFPNAQMPALGTFCLERARALRRHAEVRVVAPVPYFPRSQHLRGLGDWHRWSRVPDREWIDGIEVLHPRRVVIPRIGGVSSGWFYSRMLEPMLRELRRTYSFDVIDAHFLWPDGLAATRAARSLGVPICVTGHGTDLNLMPSFPRVRSRLRETIAGADRLVVVCGALAQVAVELGAPPDNVRVIPNGVDIERFRPVPRLPTRGALGFDAARPLLLAVGALIPRKGHEHLIDALAHLHGSGCDAQLAIVGEGPCRNALLERVRVRGLGDSVRLVGAVPHDQLHRWFSAADVTCLASSREGWPTVFFESWACGTPVVSTSVHGVPEAVVSNRFGRLVTRQDPRLMAEALRDALVGDWNVRELRDYAARNTWAIRAEQCLVELEAIVGRRRREPTSPGTASALGAVS